MAAPLFGSEYGGSAVYDINAATGAAVSIGSTGHLTNGLAYNSQTGTMYAQGDSGLYTIDTSNAATTLVGAYGSSGFTGLTFSGDYSTLYAIRNDLPGPNLYSIDPNTAVSTLVGGLEGPSAAGVFDLATDSAGTIYAMGTSGNLFTVDEVAGLMSLVGTVSGVPGGFGVTSLSFDENDLLHGITTLGDTLITIDIDTLTATTVGGDIGDDIRGLAFVIENTSQVQAPGALALFGFGLAGLGYARRRRAA